MTDWPDWDEIEMLPGFGPMRRSEIVAIINRADVYELALKLATVRKMAVEELERIDKYGGVTGFAERVLEVVG